MADFYLLAIYMASSVFVAVFTSMKLRSTLVGVCAAVAIFALLANITAAVCGSQCWPEKRTTQAAKQGEVRP
ncbi:hypothetical protein KXJ72_11505 [Comamonas aquatica]|nr:hypothetical protein KXJ72_11505 [Comamonas aquatica]